MSVKRQLPDAIMDMVVGGVLTLDGLVVADVQFVDEDIHVTLENGDVFRRVVHPAMYQGNEAEAAMWRGVIGSDDVYDLNALRCEWEKVG